MTSFIRPNRFLLIASTIGIIAILCLMILYRQLMLDSIVEHETRSNVALTRLLSNLVAHRYHGLLATDVAQIRRQGSAHTAVRTLDDELTQVMRGTRLVKVKIYNLDGLTLYSTDPRQINEDKRDNPGFVSASAGAPTSNITFRDQFDSFERTLSNINVVSSYIPVYGPESGKVEAVFELYSDVTDLVGKMEQTQWRVIGGVLFSVALLYLLLIVIARRADRTEAKRVAERIESEEQIRFQASHDSLTGLINRHEFERLAENLIADLEVRDDIHALCLLDLDQFKIVNDTCGHIAGDELLHQLGQLLRETVRPRDILARIGGDEFGILVRSSSAARAREVAESLLRAIQEFQFLWEGKTFRVGASIGMVTITRANNGLIEALQRADAACFMAKDSGRNRIHVFREGDTEFSLRHGEMQWVSRIDQALEEDRYLLYAQEIAPLEGGGGLHYELLLRMIDEAGDIVPPAAFLPAAERFDLMVKLDNWVVATGLGLMAGHPDFVEQIDFLAFNLSGQSITDAAFLQRVVTQIEDHMLDPRKICFEITETAAIANLRAATRFIATLRGIGCRFALDDFGSGLSSFGYLKSLPVDYLKIDGMFVRDIVTDPINRAMVRSINAIGQVMNKRTIAEYVENDAIRRELIDIGVDYVQGYAIGMPRPLTELLEPRRDQLVS